MHDFCFTIPYGLLLVCGGVIGYTKKGSTASLAGGTGAGLLLVLAGYLSLQAFHKRKNSYFALILETVIATILAFIMGQRYMQTGKIMPAGIVAAISGGLDFISTRLQLEGTAANKFVFTSDGRKLSNQQMDSMRMILGANACWNLAVLPLMKTLTFSIICSLPFGLEEEHDEMRL
ncbi:UNVERIFIED_CONTAM: protein FATTY ACID EXPORT 6 [Sesamum radiatum]|uniref:Protein FATTY ACID EXPORT 6 n=1 Tax=Sesamum radiatum TaxID=300843 RepID=A0AAW2K576_SESRA